MMPHDRNPRTATSFPDPAPDQRPDASGPEAEDRLSYLLTAYLFDGLSPEGRREVEEQLERDPTVAAEFEGLESTLELLGDALGAEGNVAEEGASPSPSLYAFDERRRERVLTAARRRRGGVTRFLRDHPGLKWAAVIVIVALPTLGALIFTQLTQLTQDRGYSGREMNLRSGVIRSRAPDAQGLYSYREEAAKTAENMVLTMGGSDERGVSRIDSEELFAAEGEADGEVPEVTAAAAKPAKPASPEPAQVAIAPGAPATPTPGRTTGTRAASDFKAAAGEAGAATITGRQPVTTWALQPVAPSPPTIVNVSPNRKSLEHARPAPLGLETDSFSATPVPDPGDAGVAFDTPETAPSSGMQRESVRYTANSTSRPGISEGETADVAGIELQGGTALEYGLPLGGATPSENAEYFREEARAPRGVALGTRRGSRAAPVPGQPVPPAEPAGGTAARSSSGRARGEDLARGRRRAGQASTESRFLHVEDDSIANIEGTESVYSVDGDTTTFELTSESLDGGRTGGQPGGAPGEWTGRSDSSEPRVGQFYGGVVRDARRQPRAAAPAPLASGGAKLAPEDGRIVTGFAAGLETPGADLSRPVVERNMEDITVDVPAGTNLDAVSDLELLNDSVNDAIGVGGGGGGAHGGRWEEQSLLREKEVARGLLGTQADGVFVDRSFQSFHDVAVEGRGGEIQIRSGEIVDFLRSDGEAGPRDHYLSAELESREIVEKVAELEKYSKRDAAVSEESLRQQRLGQIDRQRAFLAKQLESKPAGPGSLEGEDPFARDLSTLYEAKSEYLAIPGTETWKRQPEKQNQKQQAGQNQLAGAGRVDGRRGDRLQAGLDVPLGEAEEEVREVGDLLEELVAMVDANREIDGTRDAGGAEADDDGALLLPPSEGAGEAVVELDLEPSFRQDLPELQAKVQYFERFAKAGREGKTVNLIDLERASKDGKPAGGKWASRDLFATEKVLNAYVTYRQNDPELALETFFARPRLVPPPEIGDEGLGREAFRERYGTNPFVDPRRDRFSTISMDVDTGSFTRARQVLAGGQLPEKDTVRVEEFVNFVSTAYPVDPDEVFTVTCDGMPSPFGPEEVELLRVGIKARELREGERRNAVITLAIDASGSMAEGSHLDLIKGALEILVRKLEPTDRIAIVAYSDQANLVLPHTLARQSERILGALNSLRPRGGTNVEAGLDLAYRIAHDALSPESLHRVILVSDGVANVGARGPEKILEKIRVFARRGIYLTTVGVGQEKYDDRMLERLADEGNGNYAFVASIEEASRIFEANLPATLEVLAEDAKIQVEFPPEAVSAYRLIGYENRDIADEDFRNDKVDAAEVGPGSTVTVLFEIVRQPGWSGPVGKVFVRYRDTATRRIVERDFPVPPGVISPSRDAASDELRLLATVAELAELLRESYFARDGSYGDLLVELARIGGATRQGEAWASIDTMARQALMLNVKKHLASARGGQSSDGL